MQSQSGVPSGSSPSFDAYSSLVGFNDERLKNCWVGKSKDKTKVVLYEKPDGFLSKLLPKSLYQYLGVGKVVIDDIKAASDRLKQEVQKLKSTGESNESDIVKRACDKLAKILLGSSKLDDQEMKNLQNDYNANIDAVFKKYTSIEKDNNPQSLNIGEEKRYESIRTFQKNPSSLQESYFKDYKARIQQIVQRQSNSSSEQKNVAESKSSTVEPEQITNASKQQPTYAPPPPVFEGFPPLQSSGVGETAFPPPPWENSEIPSSDLPPVPTDIPPPVDQEQFNNLPPLPTNFPPSPPQ